MRGERKAVNIMRGCVCGERVKRESKKKKEEGGALSVTRATERVSARVFGGAKPPARQLFFRYGSSVRWGARGQRPRG